MIPGWSRRRAVAQGGTSDYEWDLPVEVAGRKVRNRRRVRDDKRGTLDVSTAEAARQPFRLRTKKE